MKISNAPIDLISDRLSFIDYVKTQMRHKLVTFRSCLHCLQYVCKSRVFEPRHDISNNVVYAHESIHVKMPHCLGTLYIIAKYLLMTIIVITNAVLM